MKTSISGDHWLRTRPIAHRGLHDINRSIPENSLLAFENACKNNFPIELDVRITKNKKAVVFHDVNLKRMTGVNKLISKVSSQDLRSIKILETNENIPLLEEALGVINGRVPVLIEIKRHFLPGRLEKDVIKALKNYKGEFALVSFNPLALRFIRKKSSEFICGINIGKAEKYFFQNAQINNFVYSLATPDFISYSMRGQVPDKSSVFFKSQNLPILAWTVRSPDDEKRARVFADNIIFENYIPE